MHDVHRGSFKLTNKKFSIKSLCFHLILSMIYFRKYLRKNQTFKIKKWLNYKCVEA